MSPPGSNRSRYAQRNAVRYYHSWTMAPELIPARVDKAQLLKRVHAHLQHHGATIALLGPRIAEVRNLLPRYATCLEVVTAVDLDEMLVAALAEVVERIRHAVQVIPWTEVASGSGLMGE